MTARIDFKKAFGFIRANRAVALAVVEEFWHSENYVTEEDAYRDLGCASTMMWPAIRAIRMRESADVGNTAQRLAAERKAGVYQYDQARLTQG